MNTRRNVLRWMALAAGAVSGLIPALGRKPLAQVFSQETTDEPEFQKIATLEDLEKGEGSFFIKDGFEGNPVLIVETEVEPEGETETPEKAYVAVDPTCPHRKCLVDWNTGKSAFVCPCHASEFDLEGNVTKGPANTGLPALYSVKVEGEDIMIAPMEA